MSKLCHYGIRGLANKLFESYLADSKQFVSINGFASSISNIIVVFHKNLFWDPYFFCYILMILI